MKSRNLYIMVTIAFALLLVAFAPIPDATAGVRTANLRIEYFSSPETAFAALQAGDVDCMIWPLTKQQYAVAITDPNIVLGPVLENGMREFDLNGNETIAAYPGVNSPTSYWRFRAALACLSDKQYMVNSICGGFASRMDVAVVANAPTWLNTSVIFPNYPWEYDPEYAADLLDEAGFVEGTTDNGYYDDEFPGSVENIRVYPDCAPVHDNPHIGVDLPVDPPYVYTLTFNVCIPVPSNLLVMGVPPGGHLYQTLVLGTNYTWVQVGSGGGDEIKVNVTVITPLQECTYLWMEYNTTHPKAGLDLDPIMFYARVDDPLRLAAGTLLCDNMRKHGIPVALFTLNSPGCRPFVMAARNYHVYTGGWSLGRYPVSLYALYESSHWFPNGANYINPPCPRPSPGPCVSDPNIDVLATDIYYTTDIPSAMLAAQAVQPLLVKKCVNIPLWTAASFYAWRSWLLGVVNMKGYGPLNGYTFMDAYKATGAPEQNVLRLGMNQAPQCHNILFAQWTYDYALLDRYWEGGQAVNPYDLATDQPWVVQDWTPTTWTDPDDDTVKTACIFWLRQDVSWAEPVTGDYIRSFTAHDVEFGNMFHYAFDDAWNWDNIMDVDHIELLDDYSYKICFVTDSYWFQYAANYPYLPKEEWGDLFCTPTVYSEPGATYDAEDSLVINEGHGVAQIQSITVGGSPFTNYWTRFNYTGDVFSANRIYFKGAVSGDLVINYWNITGDPHGYYHGSDTEWIPNCFACGQFIPVEITKDTHALFKRNDYFFLDTPPLGEIDWYWWYDANEPVRDTSRPAGGPRTGCFLVDIYDVTFATVSYGSTGYLEPTGYPLPWFPGADLAPSYTEEVPYGGEIDIYDVSSILVSYGTEHSRTPVS